MRTPSSTTSTRAEGFRRFEVITGVGRRRRWSDEDKARIVAESLDPATTASPVPRRYGLHASQLFTWRQQLQRSASRAETIGGPGVAPAVLAEDRAAPPQPLGRMEIALGPAVVRVGTDVDAAALRRVLEVVRWPDRREAWGGRGRTKTGRLWVRSSWLSASTTTILR